MIVWSHCTLCTNHRHANSFMYSRVLWIWTNGYGRYGLVGPNGAGKSTIMRFLASGRLPLPAAVDVLLVEQEVDASELPVVEQVCCRIL